jgi:hypothetical protein
MEKKQSVETVRADLRVLNELTTENTVIDSWLTPAFWTMATTAATNLIAVAALIGWVKSSEVESLTQAIIALVGAAQVVVVNSVLVWKYIAGQNALQAQKVTAKYKYMEAVAVERLRAK